MQTGNEKLKYLSMSQEIKTSSTDKRKRPQDSENDSLEVPPSKRQKLDNTADQTAKNDETGTDLPLEDSQEFDPEEKDSQDDEEFSEDDLDEELDNPDDDEVFDVEKYKKWKEANATPHKDE